MKEPEAKKKKQSKDDSSSGSDDEEAGVQSDGLQCLQKSAKRCSLTQYEISSHFRKIKAERSSKAQKLTKIAGGKQMN